MVLESQQRLDISFLLRWFALQCSEWIKKLFTCTQLLSCNFTYYSCLSVCPYDKTKTAATKITKLGVEIVHHEYHESSITNITLTLDQKVKGQGHRVTKCKKTIEWPAWIIHSIECPALVGNSNIRIHKWHSDRSNPGYNWKLVHFIRIARRSILDIRYSTMASTETVRPVYLA